MHIVHTIQPTFSRRNRLRLTIALTGLLVGCMGSFNVLHSDLTVQAGRQFILGGNQKGAFTVRASNTGNVAFVLTEQLADGRLVGLGLFAPGAAQTVRFAAGSAVLISNRSAQPARLDLTVTGDKDNLTMQERTPEDH